MNFEKELKQATLIKRYKRFFADLNYKGETITAHVPNTGSLKTVLSEGAKCYFSTNDNPKRKLKYTLELIQTATGLAGVNTRTPNTITHEALLEGLKGKYEFVQPEVKISDKSRIDFVIWNPKDPSLKIPKKLKYPDYLEDQNLDLHFVEVKNATMAKNNEASFPDGVTERGTKHLNELIELKKKGHSTEILFCVQREGMKSFSPAYDIDPLYCKTLKKAKKEKVQISAYPASLNKKRVCLNWTNPLKINL